MRIKIIFWPIFFLFFLSNGFSSEDGWEVITKKISQETLEKINNNYLREIKPIFNKKCLDCHGSRRELPWYFALPGAKQLMEYDMREAKEHMDMGNDFPFKGHGTLKDDLEALAKTIKNDKMPPLRYLLLHWDSSLTVEEKQKINIWITNSLKKIK